MKKFKLLSFLLLLAPFTQAQTTISIEPDMDNSMYSENTNSNGIGQLYSGQTCSDNSRRALLHFDIAGSIPEGSVITGVNLTLNVDNVSPDAEVNDFSLHTVSTEWGEGTSSGGGEGATAIAPDANWTDAMLGTSTWTTPGGDYTVAASATTSLLAETGDFVWTDAEMVANVSAWLDDPSTNFGWILIGTEGETCTARRFGSKDVGTAPSLEITYECTGELSVLCQSVELFLDADGEGVIDDSDIDGGSISCAGGLTFTASQTAFTCADIFEGPIPASLVISGAYDASLTGGTPKGIELYVINDIEDLSIYGVGSANNGGGTDGEEFTFPAESATAGSYIYVSTDSVRFEEWFGFYPNFNSGSMSINGDDAIELFKDGEVIDVFGDIDTDGSGEDWEYLDGWAYRLSNTGPDGAVFNIANWSFSGPNEWDGETANATAESPMAVGTFTTAPTVGAPVTLTVVDAGGAIGECTTVVVVIDTLAPTVSCVGEYTLVLDATGAGTIDVEDLDAGTTDGCEIASMTLSATSFTCADAGENEVMLIAEDIYGNIDSCAVTVTVDVSEVITISEDMLVLPSCAGVADGAIFISLEGGTPDYSIDWDNDGTGDADDPDDIWALAAGEYVVIVTDANGCESTETFVLTEPELIEGVAVITNESCDGSADGAIDVTVSGGTAPYTYVWSKDGDATFEEVTEDIVDLSAGDYVLTISDASGCSQILDYTVLLESTVDITVDLGVSLTSNEDDGVYQWLMCPSYTEIDGATDQSYTPTEEGSYAVKVTNTDGCVDTSECYDFIFDSIEEFEKYNVAIYPNPSNGTVTIESTDLDVNTVINITDINGRTTLKTIIEGPLTVVDLSVMENGIYLVHIQTNDGILIKKVTLSK